MPRSFKRVLPSRIHDHNLVSISDFHHSFYMSLPLRLPSSDRPSDVLKAPHNYISSNLLPFLPSCPYHAVLTLNYSSTLKFRGTFHTPYDRSNYTFAYCNFRFLLGKLEDGNSWMLLPRELQNMFRLRTRMLGCEHARSKTQILLFCIPRVFQCWCLYFDTTNSMVTDGCK